jgi:hypothetical protein
MRGTKATLTKRVFGALAGLVALAALAPAVAWAQPVARVTAYEVLEALQFKKPMKHWHWHPSMESVLVRRFAEAALLGDNILPLQPDPLFAVATHVGAAATSNVNITPGSKRFGLGPIRGEFDLLKLEDLDGNGNPNLSDLVVIASGRFQGMLDLRPALVPDPQTGMPRPLALVSGTWNLNKGDKGEQKPGPLSGVFLIPFELPGFEGIQWYLNPPDLDAGGALPTTCRSNVVVDFGFGNICQLSAEEYVLGFPLTKAVIFLNQ